MEYLLAVMALFGLLFTLLWKEIPLIAINNNPSSYRKDLLIVAFILIAGLKLTSGLENSLDIILYDESDYLYWGVKLTSLGFPAAAWAPLYSMWYYIISFFSYDNVNLYYMNYELMTVLPPILAYALFRKNGVPIDISCVVSWFFLVSPANIYVLPKVSHFALILIFFTFILISRIGSLFLACLFASIGALFVSYIRPEYFFVYLLSSSLCILVCILEFKKPGRQYWRYLPGFMALGIFSALLLGVLGLPVDGDRSMAAFGQHFSLHWVSWSGSKLNPWTNWQEIMSQNFGTARSMPAAFTDNPAMFLRHMYYNIPELMSASYRMVTFNITKGVMAAYLVIISVPFVYRSNIRSNFREYKKLLLLIGLFILPEIISVIIIYPRTHYLLLLLVLTVTIVTILLFNHSIEQTRVSWKRLLILGLILIVLTPNLFSHKGEKRPNMDTIRFIQSLKCNEPVNLLEAEGGYNIYLGDNFHRVAEYDKNTDFNHFLVDRNINMIVVSDYLQKDTRFKDDSKWKAFLADHDRFGYSQLDIPNTGRKLIIRNNLLHE